MFVPLYFFYFFVILVCTFTLALDHPLFCSVPCTLLQLTIQATILLHHLAPDHPPLSPRSLISFILFLFLFTIIFREPFVFDNLAGIFIFIFIVLIILKIFLVLQVQLVWSSVFFQGSKLRQLI